MTVETKQMIEFSDIVALEFDCKQCKAKVTFNIADSKRLLVCPVCNADWLTPQTKEEEFVRLLIWNLRDAVENLKGRPFSVKLQIAESKAKDNG